jgi:hypothetical protein
VRYLVRMIDDATSWSWGRFVESDATPQNMAVLWEYLEKNGRIEDVYTDRHSLNADWTGAARVGIGWIVAYSPLARGREGKGFRNRRTGGVRSSRRATPASWLSSLSRCGVTAISSRCQQLSKVWNSLIRYLTDSHAYPFRISPRHVRSLRPDGQNPNAQT